MNVSIKVVPNSAKGEIVGWLADVLKIKVWAVAENGKANKVLIHFLAKKLKVEKQDIKVLSGLTSSYKLLNVKGLDESSLEALLPD